MSDPAILCARLTWRGFLRRHNTPMARIILGINAPSCKVALHRLDVALKHGKIDAESHALRTDACKSLYREYMDSRPHVNELDTRDYHKLTGDRGGYQRATHPDSGMGAG